MGLEPESVCGHRTRGWGFDHHWGGRLDSLSNRHLLPKTNTDNTHEDVIMTEKLFTEVLNKQMKTNKQTELYNVLACNEQNIKQDSHVCFNIYIFFES